MHMGDFRPGIEVSGGPEWYWLTSLESTETFAQERSSSTVWPVVSTAVLHSFPHLLSELGSSPWPEGFHPMWCASVKCIRTFTVSLMKKCAESQASIIKLALGQGECWGQRDRQAATGRLGWLCRNPPRGPRVSSRVPGPPWEASGTALTEQ